MWDAVAGQTLLGCRDAGWNQRELPASACRPQAAGAVSGSRGPDHLPALFHHSAFFTPDEPNQSCRAISLSHGALLAHMGESEAGAEIDANVFLVMDDINDIRMAWEKRGADFHNRPYGPMTGELQLPLSGVRWARKTVFVPFANTAVYPPVLYLPAMLGWRVGEAADLTIFESLRLARLLSALTAVALGWLASRICACPRWFLVMFLLLPSTLFLNASCSQDSVLLSVAALIAAMLSRPLIARREFTPSELAITTALLALCGTARPPYMAMALLLFLPRVELPNGSWRRWLPPAAGFACVLAIGGLWRHLVMPFGLEWSNEADPETQEIFLRAHPFSAAWALLHGTGTAAVDFVRRGLYVVGWNDLLAPRGLAITLGVCLLVIVLSAPCRPVRTWRGRVLLAVCVIAPLLGISLAEYIIWTPPGFHTVYGIQPRYWLPLMPFAAFLLRGVPRPASASAPRTFLLLGATGILAIVACTLPRVAAHAFYQDSVIHVLLLNLR